MPFICHHCGKHLSRQQRLDSHIDRYHRQKDVEQCHDTGVDKDACATKKKMKRSHWDISEKEYNEKMRLCDKLPSMWEQRTGDDLVQPLLQEGCGNVKKDIFSKGGSDSDSNDAENEANDMESNDADSEASDMEEEDTDDDDAEEEDSNWVFNFMKQQAKDTLDIRKKDDGVDYDIKDFRKSFRCWYAKIIKWIHALRQNDIHKKVLNTAYHFRSDGYDYKESIDAAIAKRKFLLNRLITEEDLMDEESDTDV